MIKRLFIPLALLALIFSSCEDSNPVSGNSGNDTSNDTVQVRIINKTGREMKSLLSEGLSKIQSGNYELWRMTYEFKVKTDYKQYGATASTSKRVTYYDSFYDGDTSEVMEFIVEDSVAIRSFSCACDADLDSDPGPGMNLFGASESKTYTFTNTSSEPNVFYKGKSYDLIITSDSEYELVEADF